MPRKSTKQPKTDDEIIKFLISNNIAFRESDSDTERKILTAELHAKFAEDIRYVRGTSAIIVLGESNSACGETQPLKFEEIKKVYDKIGDIPKSFRNNPEAFYMSMILYVKKQTEIEKGIFNAYT